MPELPEVQTIVDDLNKKVIGKKIIAAWFDWPKMKPVEKAVGHTIKKVIRRGKNILFYLNKDNILLVHQKMTGHVLVGKWKITGKKVEPIEPKIFKEKVNGYIHFILTLNDKKMIGLSDLRKFAKVVFGPVEKIENLPDLKNLGPDALEISLKELSERISKRKQTIYQVLMDQGVVSGIGNIYASDVLFEAKAYPFQPANKLKPDQVEKIWRAIKKILALSLKLRGTSTSDYRDTAGEPGEYTDHRLVYDREGLPCYECGTKIKRIKRGGRSSYFCPACQRI
ncbi:MAG: bifunctional DNA-formamidopyrimidine glycosylase/DNA-(apurinic or apyrimidinic site) lyase [Patescibacteria group bacterium]